MRILPKILFVESQVRIIVTGSAVDAVYEIY